MKTIYYLLIFSISLFAFSSCEGNEERKTKELELATAKDRLLTEEKNLQILQKEYDEISNSLAENKQQQNKLGINKSLQSSTLARLKSELEIAKDKLEDAKNFKLFRNDSQRENDIREASERIFNLEKLIKNTEEELSSLQSELRGLQEQVFSLNSRKSHTETQLQRSRESIPLYQKRVAQIEEELK